MKPGSDDISHDTARAIRRLAKENRKNPTDAEVKLWRHLRDRRLSGHKFKRQHKIARYIVDFVCLEQKLIVELDGGQHTFPDYAARDMERTAALNGLGFRVLRFWNSEALRETESVLEVIFEALGGDAEVCRPSGNAPSPRPSPPHGGEGDHQGRFNA